MISRASAYLLAMTKTAGREFTFDGTPVLTDDERGLLRRAELQDFADSFRLHVGTVIELHRLDALDRRIT